MQIIIPMSGEGSRFKAAGYTTIKPLIKVNGKPIIEYVVEMFPGDHEFLFICREDHNEQYGLDKYLAGLCAKATVVKIPPHKLGPVYAVLQAKEYVKTGMPVMVSYCDYFMKWDFQKFCDEAMNEQYDGNVICYKGFHPHLLHEKNVYAGCKVDEQNNLLEITEKFSYEADKTKGLHSGGAYYFGNGGTMLHYFQKSYESDNSLNGEFYVSLVYNLLIQDKLKVKVYDELPHFCQWGTPEDLEEFLYWSDIFLKHHYA